MDFNLNFIPQLNVSELPSNICMQRPQFGLLHFFTAYSSLEVNFALVSKRLRLYGCLLLLMSLNFDKIPLIFSSSSKIGNSRHFWVLWIVRRYVRDDALVLFRLNCSKYFLI